MLPEQIASQLKGWGCEERISERSREQTVDLPVPQVIESVEMQLECGAEQITDLPVPQILGERVLNRTPEHGIPVPQIVEERVQNRTLEQTAEFPVPRVLEAVGAVLPSTPQERVLNRTQEQIVGVPEPRIMELPVDVVLSSPQERVQNCTPKQIMDFPVPQNMEVYAGIVRDTPPERVQNRTPETIVDVPMPHIKEDGLLLVPQERVHNRAVYTGKVFTVKLRHHRDDQASLDNVGFIKGLDKHNMPRLGDVMVPPPRSSRALWAMWSKWFPGSIGSLRLLRTSLCTAFKQSARAAAAAPSSNGELLQIEGLHNQFCVSLVSLIFPTAACGTNDSIEHPTFTCIIGTMTDHGRLYFEPGFQTRPEP